MSANSRHDRIITLVRKMRKVSVQDLTERLGVTRVTVRKDLSFLEEKGFLLRTHGGAVLAENSYRDQYFLRREEQHIQEKKRIARKAADLILEDDTIYIDSGSTAALLAREIAGESIRVLTNSLDVINILSRSKDSVLISVGGSFRKEAGSFIGPQAEGVLRHFSIDVAFLGSSGISSQGAFSSYNIFESQLKRAVLSSSKRKIILADSSKYGREAFSVFADSNDIDLLITDSNFPLSAISLLEGIEVITV